MFKGSIVAIVTPFKGDAIDKESFKNLMDFHVKNGTSAVVVAGTTGESPTLSHDEHKEIVDIAVEHLNGRIPVIAGTGSNSTKEAIELTLAAKESGADAILVVNPYYNRPTQEGLYRHYMKIADATDLPMIVYNIPARTSGKIELQTMIKIAEHKNIIGVKDATGNLSEAAYLLKILPDFKLYSGDDLLTLAFIAIGGSGVISVAANIVPKQFSEMLNAALSGDFAKARKLFFDLSDLMEALTLEVNPIPIKTAIALKGMIDENFRLPLCNISDTNKEKLKKVMQQMNLI